MATKPKKPVAYPIKPYLNTYVFSKYGKKSTVTTRHQYEIEATNAKQAVVAYFEKRGYVTIEAVIKKVL